MLCLYTADLIIPPPDRRIHCDLCHELVGQPLDTPAVKVYDVYVHSGCLSGAGALVANLTPKTLRRLRGRGVSIRGGF